MNSIEVRNKYIQFFEKNGHHHIPSSGLVPEKDPTTLFISSGMQPLLKYFLGENHPNGNRIVDSQVCLRAHGFMDDLLEVGDNRHTSMFEMLGNWSFGDYYKKEQINFFYDFLTKELALDPKRLFITCFIGDSENKLPKDNESVLIWQEIFKREGVDCEIVEFESTDDANNIGNNGARICLYPAKKNWWSRNGVPSNMPDGDIGGPDTEVFYDFQISHDERFGPKCHPNCDCGKYLEIGNSVFTQYIKKDSKFEELPSKNVDFGGGLERLVAVSNKTDDVFETDLYQPVIKRLEFLLNLSYSENKSLFRIIADHMKSSTFLGFYGVAPSNKQQGYVLRKFIRRSAIKIYLYNKDLDFGQILCQIPESVYDIYKEVPQNYGFNVKPELLKNISEMILNECVSFKNVLNNGFKIIEKTNIDLVGGKFIFDLYQNYGFPFEVSYEIYKQKGKEISHSEFLAEFNKHRAISK